MPPILCRTMTPLFAGLVSKDGIAAGINPQNSRESRLS